MTINVLFINHKKSHCGVYEIGKRIHDLLDGNGFYCSYVELDTLEEYHYAIEVCKPDVIVYNYVQQTMVFLTPEVSKLYPHIKHIAIIHDSFNYLYYVEAIFDAWIVHDLTNTSESKKKFLTVRPIPRFTRETEIDLDNLSFGSHGFSISPWKMYDTMVEYINYAFDKATINLNLPVATFGGSLEQSQYVANLCKSKVTKPHIILNITHDYLDTEVELISWLSKNTMNMYFYNDKVYTNMGVAGSADLAIASQSSLAVNNAYMYRHVNSILGGCTKENINDFVYNYKDVEKLYNEWSPNRIVKDYINMVETIL